jgi:hypothetical protein
MGYRFTGSITIDDPDILITKWRIRLLNPTDLYTHENVNENASYGNPVTFDIVISDNVPIWVLIEPYFDYVWMDQMGVMEGEYLIVNDPENPFIYRVDTTTGDGNTGTDPVPWPTTPGETVTVGEVTYLCVGQRVQPQIEGPVWGTYFEEA